ncbi:glucose dehydrogenase [FAD, quinone] [Hyalella azteca]|uniref:Glucose dehydrogenase [FAD, quinone] n=1 Tax=Hyalella azteca TaxID=294128 RepID=A0A8B7P5B7_HYAAZ|nr:glucose dehydrogenase [FAD, quinone] [Hyalella azteca]
MGKLNEIDNIVVTTDGEVKKENEEQLADLACQIEKVRRQYNEVVQLCEKNALYNGQCCRNQQHKEALARAEHEKRESLQKLQALQQEVKKLVLTIGDYELKIKGVNRKLYRDAALTPFLGRAMEFMSNLMSGVTTLSITTLRLVLLAAFSQHLPYRYPAGLPTLPAYDFVVVGAGAAGSVVAARLAEAGAMVLLLEAGPAAPPESAVPGLNPLLIGGDRDWRLRTVPQRHSQHAYVGNSVPMPLGRGVGGGTTINGLQYVRGSPQDFDYWASLGNEGWDFQSVLPYFRKSEDFRGKITPETAAYRSRGGRYSVEHKLFRTPVLGAFLAAGRELGYRVIDPNAGSQIGFSATQVTVRKALRSSTSESFLRPLARLRNLHVRPMATVTKITVVAELEGVGRNLNDHHVVNSLVWTVRRGAALPPNLFFDPQSYANYARHHRGFLAAPFGIEGNAWVNLGEDHNAGWPNVQVYASSVAPNYDGGALSATFSGLRKSYFQNLYGVLQHQETIHFAPMLSRPKSRGRVLLRSRNPYDHPIIDPNFLQHPDDLKDIIAGIKFAIGIGNTTAVREGLGARLYLKPLLGCENWVLFTDAYWECYVRHLLTSFWHPVGTCKMAPATDPLGVVTHRLRLRGVSGVRVVDASVMPQITTGNTMATTVMIGERGADFIKEDWGYPHDA